MVPKLDFGYDRAIFDRVLPLRLEANSIYFQFTFVIFAEAAYIEMKLSIHIYLNNI